MPIKNKNTETKTDNATVTKNETESTAAATGGDVLVDSSNTEDSTVETVTFVDAPSDVIAEQSIPQDAPAPKTRKARGQNFPWDQDKYNVVRDVAQSIAADSEDGTINMSEFHSQLISFPEFASTGLTEAQLRSFYLGRRETLKRYNLPKDALDRTEEEINAILPPVKMLRTRIQLM